LTITHLYTSRWQVELFFKWIKTAFAHQGFLRNISERSQNPNLDCHQRYILVAIVKKKLALSHSLYTILQILSVSLFEKSPNLKYFPTTHTFPKSPNLKPQLSYCVFNRTLVSFPGNLG
jgi:hypothetical protein